MQNVTLVFAAAVLSVVFCVLVVAPKARGRQQAKGSRQRKAACTDCDWKSNQARFPIRVRFFPLEDLRPGMKGIARTVFSGTEPQEFGVEILGVLPGFPGPRQSAIIGKLSGANVEKTAVFAGMSGSPVYIDGRLVGAIAFSFPFSKEPIAGITPIKQMIDIFEKGSAKEAQSAREPRVVSFAQLAATDWKPTFRNQQ